MRKLQAIGTIFIITLSFACGSGQKQNDQKDTSNTAVASAQSDTKNILVFGDSLTAGYGLDDPASESYPAVLQGKIDSAKLPYHIINGGLSGETSAGGKNRIDWLLKQKTDVFILELGANDGLRGVPVSETAKNLQTIIDKVKAKYPQAKLVLAGMMVPPNMGADYSSAFKTVFPQLAEKNKMILIPFLLQNVAGIKQLNQADGIHPTATGAKIVAQNVWSKLKGIL
ncbi:arylesterase [Mucilaginibacter sp. PPCGB 2223]|uniref:arylesterase n=1 Tax=Mucilaginibacter sp. PPCGB 2223 TaxID=1886027 RepID=UPI0008247226|nr:arylesterase [Mucilaginibacter sp. PPCGB 2223]OCX53122.1 arylesterase [Mucilaginibacter sp. PPCGB 2223]